MTNFYIEIKEEMKINFNTQGDIFEILCVESLEWLFGDWLSYQTGWSKTRSNFSKKIEEISARLKVNVLEKPPWFHQRIKDLGLDILLYKGFDDNNDCKMSIFVQCASGGNYVDKFGTPSLELWSDLIRFRISPIVAFTTPFSFNKKDFDKNTRLTRGLFVDRFRLLSFKLEDSIWMNDDLKNKITKFINPKLKKFPKLN